MPPFIQAIIPILPAIVGLLPFIAFGVSYWLQRSTYSAKQNATIASATILIAVIITALLQGKFTGNMDADIGYVLTFTTALQMEVYGPLQRFLRGEPDSTTPQPEPQPIIFPPDNKGAGSI